MENPDSGNKVNKIMEMGMSMTVKRNRKVVSCLERTVNKWKVRYKKWLGLGQSRHFPLPWMETYYNTVYKTLLRRLQCGNFHALLPWINPWWKNLTPKTIYFKTNKYLSELLEYSMGQLHIYHKSFGFILLYRR